MKDDFSQPEIKEKKSCSWHSIYTGLLFLLVLVLAVCFVSQTDTVDTVEVNGINTITMDYAKESFAEFIDAPHSYNLDRVACACFYAKLMTASKKPDEMINLFVNQSDEYKRKILILLKYSHWFTDYFYKEPIFMWKEFTFKFDGERSDRKFWQVEYGQRKTFMTWGQVVCTVMDIEYDPVYDYGLYIPPIYVEKNSEDNSLFRDLK